MALEEETRDSMNSLHVSDIMGNDDSLVKTNICQRLDLNATSTSTGSQADNITRNYNKTVHDNTSASQTLFSPKHKSPGSARKRKRQNSGVSYASSSSLFSTHSVSRNIFEDETIRDSTVCTNTPEKENSKTVQETTLDVSDLSDDDFFSLSERMSFAKLTQSPYK